MMMKSKFVKGMGLLILAIMLMQISSANAIAPAVTLDIPNSVPHTGFTAFVYYSGFQNGRTYYGVIQQKLVGSSTWVTVSSFYMSEPALFVYVSRASVGLSYFRAIVYDNGVPQYSNYELVEVY